MRVSRRDPAFGRGAGRCLRRSGPGRARWRRRPWRSISGCCWTPGRTRSVAADAAALAGASAFLTANGTAAIPAARNEALRAARAKLRVGRIDRYRRGAAAGTRRRPPTPRTKPWSPSSRLRRGFGVRIRRAAITTGSPSCSERTPSRSPPGPLPRPRRPAVPPVSSRGRFPTSGTKIRRTRTTTGSRTRTRIGISIPRRASTHQPYSPADPNSSTGDRLREQLEKQ